MKSPQDPSTGVREPLRKKTERVWYSHNAASSEVVPNHQLHNHFNIQSFGCRLRIVLRCNSMPRGMPLCCCLVAQWHSFTPKHNQPQQAYPHRHPTMIYVDLCFVVTHSCPKRAKNRNMAIAVPTATRTKTGGSSAWSVSVFFAGIWLLITTYLWWKLSLLLSFSGLVLSKNICSEPESENLGIFTAPPV